MKLIITAATFLVTISLLLGGYALSNHQTPQLAAQIYSPSTTPSPSPSATPVIKKKSFASPITPIATQITTPAPTSTAIITPSPVSTPTQTPTPSPTATATPVSTTGHTFYTSSYATSKYYYCDTDPGWQTLSKATLKSFPSASALLATYPTRISHEACK